MRHIISLLLRNEAGALARVASLFSTRGYNIESLSVAPTDEADISRLTLVTIGNDQTIAQIGNQLSKLVDVVDITDLTLGDHIERELLLLKCQVPAEALEKIRELCRSEGARVLDDTLATYTLELTGAGGRVDALIQRVAAHAEILDVVRSGPLGIVRGQASLAAASRA
jgi:acetolactate synthase I/III small subunit